MDSNEIRAAKINGLRKMADWFEANPNVPLPYDLGGCSFVTMDEAREIRKTAPGWVKSAEGEWFEYHLSFAIGRGMTHYNNVNYHLYVAKTEDTCKRVQVGTKVVPAIEAHEEPIYQWQCGPANADEIDVEPPAMHSDEF